MDHIFFLFMEGSPTTTPPPTPLYTPQDPIPRLLYFRPPELYAVALTSRLAAFPVDFISTFCCFIDFFSFSIQDDKNQIITTNVWVRQVSTSVIRV